MPRVPQHIAIRPFRPVMTEQLQPREPGGRTMKTHGSYGESDNATMLDALREHRVFTVQRDNAGCYEFTEACDEYFFAVLTREQVVTLAGELLTMAQLEDAR